MSMEDIQKRLGVLEDIDSIKKLKARYCAYCDDNYNLDGLASLFTEDAVWDGGPFRGRHEGREAIREFFTDAPQRLPFAVHMVLNPVIEVDGDTAKGMWYLFQSCTYAEGNKAVWGSARYDEEYVKVNGEWKFKNLKLTSFFWTPFDEGWVKNNNA
jgi:ketosteroid isomerase-like protein